MELEYNKEIEELLKSLKEIESYNESKNVNINLQSESSKNRSSIVKKLLVSIEKLKTMIFLSTIS